MIQRSKVTNIRWILCALTCGFLLFSIGGCSRSNSNISAYASEFAAAIESTESEYVRNILDDGVISAEEYRDSHQQMLSCLNKAGIPASYIDSAGLGYENLNLGETNEVQNEAMNTCYSQWIGEIETLYHDILINPNNEDLSTLVAACLVRKGLAPQGFKASDYDEMMADIGVPFTITSDDPYMLERITTESEPAPILPSGISMGDDRALMCQLAPLK